MNTQENTQQKFKEILNGSTSLQTIDTEYRSKIDELKNPSSLKRYLVFGGLLFGGTLLLSLFATQIISGSIALIVSGLTAVLGWYGIKVLKNLDPVIQKKLSNQKMKLLIEEAQSKKIETLSNYVLALDDYYNYSKNLKKKVSILINKYKDKLSDSTDEYLTKEYQKILEKLELTLKSIDKIMSNSKDKKDAFQKQLKIAKEKMEFINDTKDIVSFLESEGSNSLDKMLVDESLNSLEKEFLEITGTIESIANNIEEDKND